MVSPKAEKKQEDPIIIDDEKKLIFSTEDEVLKYFAQPIQHFEKEFLKIREEDDFSDEESLALEEKLEDLLQNPDEVWKDEDSFKKTSVYNFIKCFHKDDDIYYYVAIAYLAGEVPTFIFLHFATKHDSTCQHYRRGELVFDKSVEDVEMGGIEGDALSEGDELAVGLYKSMITVRSDKDIQESMFQNYGEMREETIEEADEIWRNTTISGYTLVTFIKDFSRMDGSSEPLFYLAVTLEDSGTNSHALLFSFPTNDESLVDRYRHGENLQADEVIQESSH